MKPKLQTRQEVRKHLAYTGTSITAWARKNGFSADQVRDVLRKETPCRFGHSHKIAVLLGIKDGVIQEE
jgi:gp16 family phage-associated protein